MNLSVLVPIVIWAGILSGLWWLTSNAYHFVGNLLASYFLAWGLLFLLSEQTRAEKMRRFATTTISLCLLAGVLETLALIRLVDYRAVFSTAIFAPWRNPKYLLDPELIHIRRPFEHLRGVARGGDIAWLFHIPTPQVYRYDVTYDRHGFRNADDLRVADIAVLGDSFVEAPNVSRDDLMTSVLSRLRNVTVANLGQIGYGPQHEFVVLKRYALPLRPGIIVWAFFEGNDLKNVHVYNDVTADWPANSRSFHSFPERSFTKNLLLGMFRLLGNPKPSAEKRSAIIRDPDGKSTRLYFLYPGSPLSSGDLQALDQTVAVVRAAHELCVGQGTKLLVVFIPTKFRVYRGLAECDAESECLYWVVNDLPERFRARLRETSPNIDYLDLTPKLIEEANNGAILYFSDDSHWSPDGHKMAAYAISEYISRMEGTRGQRADRVHWNHESRGP